MTIAHTSTNIQISRHEFEAAMRRIEALLATQTEILVKLAATEASNQARDLRIAEAKRDAEAALTAVARLNLFAAKAAGASAVLAIFGEKALKSIGML